jgi:hypothetical protein
MRRPPPTSGTGTVRCPAIRTVTKRRSATTQRSRRGRTAFQPRNSPVRSCLRLSPRPARTPSPASSRISVTIRNPHTPRAYFRNAVAFLRWCEDRGLRDLKEIKPVLVAAYIEQLQQTNSKPAAKQQLATIRMLFDWLVTGQVVGANPAHAVRGPKHVVSKGKTPLLTAGPPYP